ncbi:hypothetical protein ACIP4W_39315 [Streptomyces sp. NPDC088846]|uniref:hypothetical protein n=1 Tax=unclassified Streptomyces TaxID=2593676 RepID=UPI0038149802
MTDFKGFEWVVWRLEVKDPSQLAGEDPDLNERTQETMTELAASLGCVYELCVDYDSYDETPYYAWWVRMPATEHARIDKDGLPLAIAPLRQYLNPASRRFEVGDHAGPRVDVRPRRQRGHAVRLRRSDRPVRARPDPAATGRGR